MVIREDVLYKIHFHLFESNTKPKPKLDIEKIDSECEINNVSLTQEHCDFLEFTKYLIRNWNRLGDDYRGYEQIKPGDAVMYKVFKKIREKLRNLHDNRVDLILDEAEQQIDEKKIILHLSKEAAKYKEKLPVILKTIHSEYGDYLKELQVFDVKIDPSTLDVRNSDGHVRVTGSVSKPYQKTTGKIIFRISLLGFKDEEEFGFVKFVKNSISGNLKFPQGYANGEHVLYGYFQLEGERPPNRFDAYAKSEKIPIKIKSKTNT